MIDGKAIDFASVFEVTSSAYAILDHGLTIRHVNASFCDIVGQGPGDLIGASALGLWPNRAEAPQDLIDMFQRALSGNAATLAENDRDGTGRQLWTIHCTPLPDASLLFQIVDVTKEVTYRERTDVFAGELQHRIGNVLNIVQVLARKTGQSADDLQPFLAAFNERIVALGKTHSLLSGRANPDMSLHEILEQQLSVSLVSRQGAVTFDGPAWKLSIHHAQAFALAIHELVMNSLKFGALCGDAGTVDISWGHPADGSRHFFWREFGLQGLQEPIEKGFGMQMLTRLLPAQMGGNAVHSFTPNGFHYALVVPGRAGGASEHGQVTHH